MYFNYYTDAPVLNTPTSTATTISLSWTPPAGNVDSYTVSYTYTIRQCGSDVMMGPMTISGIEGSATMHMLSGLEEDSDYTITLTASTGSDQTTTVSTSTAGIQLTTL